MADHFTIKQFWKTVRQFKTWLLSAIGAVVVALTIVAAQKYLFPKDSPQVVDRFQTYFGTVECNMSISQLIIDRENLSKSEDDYDFLQGVVLQASLIGMHKQSVFETGKPLTPYHCVSVDHPQHYLEMIVMNTTKRTDTEQICKRVKFSTAAIDKVEGPPENGEKWVFAKNEVDVSDNLYCLSNEGRWEEVESEHLYRSPRR